MRIPHQTLTVTGLCICDSPGVPGETLPYSFLPKRAPFREWASPWLKGESPCNVAHGVPGGDRPSGGVNVTYILAWKFGPTIYLVADAAVTVDQYIVHNTYTSFEERSVSEPGKSVYEGALKLINLEGAAIAMVGDSALAQAIARTFKEALRLTGNPREALHTAIMSNGPFDSKRSCTLVVAFPNSPTPTLLTFNFNGDQSIIEHHEDYLFSIGSIADKYTGISYPIVQILTKMFRNEPDKFLISILAFVQSYGIHEYLPEQGVGGTFCGLLVGEHSIKWQSDVLFFLYESGRDQNARIVSSIIRDHVHVVQSLIIQQTQYFFNSVSCDSMENRNLKWRWPTYHFTDDGRFDFIVFLSCRSRIITVIEMLKHRSHRDLSITPVPSERPRESMSWHVVLSPQLVQKLDMPAPERYDGTIPFLFHWVQYHESISQV
jgi:hypothetical protein